METAPEPPVAPAEEEAGAREPAPEAGPEAEARAGKILIAHPDPQAVNMLKFVLMGADYAVISAQDGVEAMVKALKERPAAIVVDVRLPKIHGVEVMKRLKTRPETEGIQVILTGTKAEAEVPPIRGAAGYIHQDRLQQGLVEAIRQALAAPPEEPREAAPEAGTAEPSAPAQAAPAPPADAGVQRAQRFSRTVLADIELYNVEKVDQSIRQGSFEQVFAKEIQEGRKLYEMRIPEEVREKGDYYEEAVRNFLEKKRKQLGI
jgi:CheY-like chemotaxis protein